jgi:hypothetical protein
MRVLQQLRAVAQTRVDELLFMEEKADTFTNNEHYFRECKGKFLEQLKRCVDWAGRVHARPSACTCGALVYSSRRVQVLPELVSCDTLGCGAWRQGTSMGASGCRRTALHHQVAGTGGTACVDAGPTICKHDCSCGRTVMQDVHRPLIGKATTIPTGAWLPVVLECPDMLPAAACTIPCRKYHGIEDSTSTQPAPGTPASAYRPAAALHQQQAGSAQPAALPSSSEDYVLDAMAAALAIFKVASKRYADYVPMYIRHQLLEQLPHEVLTAARAEVVGDVLKEDALEAARKLLTEDKAVAKQRTELLKRQKQLECLDGKMREA